MTRRGREVGIVHAPTNLGLHPGGVEELGRALVEEGLAERIGCRELASVPAAAYDSVRSTTTHIYNETAIETYSHRLAVAVRNALENGIFPLLLGGDCSVLLGSLLALRGRCGLLFIDGHTDCYEPESSTGEVAELELGYATGLTPGALSELGDDRPLVDARDVVLFGPRDADEVGRRPAPLKALTLELAEVHRIGVDQAADRALERIGHDALHGFWTHLDVDVLDDRIMPAVDYRLPDGLSWDELATVLSAALASDRILGLQVTIFNPTLDPERRVRKRLVDELVDAFECAHAFTTPRGEPFSH